MIVASGGSSLFNEVLQRNAFKAGKKLNFEGPLTALVWITSIVSIVLTFVVSYLLIRRSRADTLWWKALDHHQLRHARRRRLARDRQGLHSTHSAHVKRS